MVQQKVQLRKIRDFGENLSDTFQFIRQEFKPLLSSFILLAGIFMLATAIVSGMYQKDAYSFLDQLEEGVFRTRSLPSILTGTYFLLIGLMLLSFTAMRTVMAVYMKYYEAHGASPTVAEVSAGFFKYFPRMFFYSIPTFLLIFIGLMFCLVPGIYLIVVFAPFAYVVVQEDLSFGKAFNRGFELVKQNFWISLGIYLVAYLIFAISSGIIGVLVGLAASVISYFTTQQLSTSVGVLVSILGIVQYIFYIIFFVSVGLHYYNLTETRDGTGLAKRLEQLGSSTNTGMDNIEEQY